jgi:putative endonuclease
MNRETGRLGEDQAARYLESKGYSIIARNFRVRAGEIDIIAVKGLEIVFAEVKSRKSQIFGGAVSALSANRIERLRNASLVFICSNDQFQNHNIRLVLLTVQNGNISEITLD